MNTTIYFTVLFNPEYSDENIRNKHLILTNGLFLINEKCQFASVVDFLFEKYENEDITISSYISQNCSYKTRVLLETTSELYLDSKNLGEDLQYKEFLNSLL